MPRLVAAAALTAAALLASSAPATAGSCSVAGKERKLGATYVTKVSTSGVGCASALRFVKRYHGCRHRHGGRDGRCRRLDGYRCSEKRTTSPTQYDSRATCRKGSRRISQLYTQNT